MKFVENLLTSFVMELNITESLFKNGNWTLFPGLCSSLKTKESCTWYILFQELKFLCFTYKQRREFQALFSPVGRSLRQGRPRAPSNWFFNPHNSYCGISIYQYINIVEYLQYKYQHYRTFSIHIILIISTSIDSCFTSATASASCAIH